MNNFLHLLCHDLRLHWRQPIEWVALVLFFLIVILLLPFAIGPEPDLLRRLAPGLIWLAVLLMNLLAIDKLFIQDRRDGTLDLMLLSPWPLPLLVGSKILAQAMAMLAALAVMLIPAVLLLGMDITVLPVLMISLALGLPLLVLLGAMIGAITVGITRNPALLTLLLIPFYIPVLIFAVAACDAALLGGSTLPHLLLLGAMLAILVPTAPFAAAAALRNAQG